MTRAASGAFSLETTSRNPRVSVIRTSGTRVLKGFTVVLETRSTMGFKTILFIFALN